MVGSCVRGALAHIVCAVLDFRFDMVFKDPAALGAQLLQAVALAADDVQPSRLHGQPRSCCIRSACLYHSGSHLI